MARTTCAAPAVACPRMTRSPMRQVQRRATRIAMDVRPCPVIFATDTGKPLHGTCMAGERASGLPEASRFVISDFAGKRCDGPAHLGELRSPSTGLKPVPPGFRQGKLEYMGAARQSEPLRAGHRAPDFKLARLENGAVQGTADLGKLLPGGPVLLAFFKSTCPVCQMMLLFLERIHRGRAPGSLEIYVVSQDDAGAPQEFAGEFGISFPMLLDPEESGYPASNAYGRSEER